jgi:hypothetical protein
MIIRMSCAFSTGRLLRAAAARPARVGAGRAEKTRTTIKTT